MKQVRHWMICVVTLVIATQLMYASSVPAQQQDVTALITGLQSNNAYARKSAADSLTKLGTSAIVPVIGALLDPESELEVREQCYRIIMVWTAEGNQPLKDAVAQELRQLKPEDYAHVGDKLERLQEAAGGTPPMTEEEALGLLEYRGCQCSVSNGYVNLYIDGWRGTPDDFRAVLSIKSPINLTSNRGMTRQLLEILAKCNVSSMELISPDFGDQDVRIISQIDGLVNLRMSSEGITDAGCEHLAKLRKLQRLAIGGSFSDVSLKYFGQLKELRTLEFQICNSVTGTGLEYLKDLDKLERLKLTGAAIRSEHYHYLHALPELKDLDTSGVKLNGLQAICQIKSLSSLRLSNSHIPDDDFASLADLPELRSLEFEWASITDRCIPRLAAIKELSRIRFSSTFVTQKGIDQLKQLVPSLEIKGQPFAPRSETELAFVLRALELGATCSGQWRPESTTIRISKTRWVGSEEDLLKFVIPESDTVEQAILALYRNGASIGWENITQRNGFTISLSGSTWAGSAEDIETLRHLGDVKLVLLRLPLSDREVVSLLTMENIKQIMAAGYEPTDAEVARLEEKFQVRRPPLGG